MSVHLQLVAAAMTLAFVAVIVRMVRKRRLRAKYSFLWIGVGGVLLLLCVVPSLLETLASSVGILYPPAVLFLGAIMLLLFLSVHLSWEISRLEDRQRTLAEELGLACTRITELEAAARPPASSETWHREPSRLA